MFAFGDRIDCAVVVANDIEWAGDLSGVFGEAFADIKCSLVSICLVTAVGDDTIAGCFLTMATGVLTASGCGVGNCSIF